MHERTAVVSPKEVAKPIRTFTMPQSSNRKGERARSPKGIELKEAKANRSRRSRQRSHRRRKRHSSSSRRRRRGRHRFRGDHSDESYSSNGDTSEGSYLTSSSDSDAEPSETEVVIPQSTRKVLSSLKAKMKSKRSKKDTSPQQNKDTPPSPRNNTAKQIGTATAKFFAVAGFKAAGKRQQIKRTELGTALGRAGTGIHSTLSNIRSDKGRARHRKFLQSEEKGVLVRPKGVFLLFSEDDNFKKIWTVVILFLVVYTSINIPLQFGFPYDEVSYFFLPCFCFLITFDHEKSNAKVLHSTTKRHWVELCLGIIRKTLYWTI